MQKFLSQLFLQHSTFDLEITSGVVLLQTSVNSVLQSWAELLETNELPCSREFLPKKQPELAFFLGLLSKGHSDILDMIRSILPGYKRDRA